MPSIELTWHTKVDERVCPICKALHNHTWKFVVGKDQFPNMLTVGGQNVWDVHQGSRAHGHERFNCRCRIESKVHQKDMVDRVQTWKNDLETQLGESP